MLDMDVKSAQASQYTTARPAAKASSPTAAPAAKPAAIQPAEFVSSPKGRIDSDSGMFVIQFRDRSSGEVTMQFPAEKAAGVYKKAESLSTSGTSGQSAPAPSPVTPPTTAPAPQESKAPDAPNATETSTEA